MPCLRVIRGVTRADRLQNIKIREDTFTPESITDVVRYMRLRWFGHVWACLPYAKKWSDHIRNDTGLPLLTAERHAMHRT